MEITDANDTVNWFHGVTCSQVKFCLVVFNTSKIQQTVAWIRIAGVAVEGSHPLLLAQGMFWPVSLSGRFAIAFGFVFAQIVAIL